MDDVIRTNKFIEYYPEDNGFYSISTNLFGRKYFMENEKKIIDQINCKVPYVNIVESYRVNSRCSKGKALEDVNSFLRELMYLKIIPISNYILLSDDKQDFPVNIAGEGQYVMLSKLITNNFNTNNNIFCSSTQKSFYNPYLLRARGFNNSEVLFYNGISDKLNAIGMTNLPNKDMPATISIIFSMTLNLSDIKELFSNIIEEIEEQKKKKIKLTSNQPATGLLLDLLNEFDFCHEANLKFEKGNLDEYIYAKYL